MSEVIVCRLCVHPCNEYRQLYDDADVYNITVKYFDPMFLNLQQHLTAICMDCWYHIFGFHTFQQSVLLAQTKFVKDEKTSDNVYVQSELAEFQNDHISPQAYDISDPSQCPPYSKVIVKEELILTDVHSDESEYSSDEEMSLKIVEISESEDAAMTTTNDQAESNILKETNKGDNPTGKTTKRGGTSQKRKSIKQLDDLIAQWRPTLECLVCHETFSRYTLLQKHFRQEHPDDEFYVLCCETKFKRRYSIEEHVRFHINQNEFACEICGKGHTTKLNLSSHMAYWHRKPVTQQDGASSAFKCDECGKTPRTLGALRKHKQRHKKQQRMATDSPSSSALIAPECGQNDNSNTSSVN